SEAEIDLGRVVFETFRMVDGDVARKGIHLGADIAPNLPGLIADERRIKQILLNLLSNAVKFTRPAGRVTVEALLLDDGGLRLAVADTGI
ncbi:MAG TPA: hypothetical protein DC046_13835, partial [Rhodospirillaceae bacterium]|nr:hypothetical protein [Rhodospirillaceae bacterium]